jgi:hypothetical protein
MQPKEFKEKEQKKGKSAHSILHVIQFSGKITKLAIF